MDLLHESRGADSGVASGLASAGATLLLALQFGAQCAPLAGIGMGALFTVVGIGWLLAHRYQLW